MVWSEALIRVDATEAYIKLLKEGRKEQGRFLEACAGGDVTTGSNQLYLMGFIEQQNGGAVRLSGRSFKNLI